jgi:SET and MYND domain-containing protein 4
VSFHTAVLDYFLAYFFNSISTAMFCSQKCKDYAMRNFHNYECPIIEILHKTGIMQMAMRMFFQAVNMFKGSVEDLQMFLSQYEGSSTSVYDFDFSIKDEEAMAKNYLASAFCLVKNDKMFINESPEKLFRLHPKLLEMWQVHSIFIKKFFSTVLKFGDSNFHGICGWSLQKYENQEPQMIGVGCYPFISLINHSCAPNVHRLYAEGRMYILVERPIKKGEQLFDCYR